MARVKFQMGQKRAARRDAFMRKRRPIPRNVAVARVPRTLSSPGVIYAFKRTCVANLTMNPSNGFTIAGNVGYGIGLLFTLNGLILNVGAGSATANLPNASEFSALFDQWRIKQVFVKYVYSNNVSTTASPTTFLPTLLVSNDNDDATVPASSAELLQRPEHKIMQLGTNGNTNNIRIVPCKPNAVVSAFTGSVFSGYADATRNQWLDCNYSTIQCYGQKVWWDVERTTNSDVGNLQLYVDFLLEFRGVR